MPEVWDFTPQHQAAPIRRYLVESGPTIAAGLALHQTFPAMLPFIIGNQILYRFIGIWLVKTLQPCLRISVAAVLALMTIGPWTAADT